MDATPNTVSLIDRAEAAGREAHEAALASYLAQFGGRRASWGDCEAAPMQSAEDALWAWADGVSEDAWPAVERAFVAGWETGAASV